MKSFIYIVAMLASIVAVIYLVNFKREGTLPAPVKSQTEQKEGQCVAPADSCPSSCSNKEDQGC